MPIGEFSERSGLSINRLRTYADAGLLVPAAVDPASGYRYYAPDQFSDAKVIDTLRQADVPLADIADFLREPSSGSLDLWDRRLEEDASRRQKALGLARTLMTVRGDSPLVSTMTDVAKEDRMTLFRTAGRTDIGRVRENNEDAIIESDRLVLVADGLGGHPGGEVASSAAADLVDAVFRGTSLDELETAVRAANWAIRDRAGADEGLDGMATTVCAAGLIGDKDLGLVNVGDSRAYLWRDGGLRQLTRDHSVTAELVERGELARENAQRHPHHGILTRALGVGPHVEIDRSALRVLSGDRLILCTDGLFNEVSSEEIVSLLESNKDAKTTVDQLVDQALDRGGKDNVSVIVADIAQNR
jgi:PPM family protein phosphatase